MIKQQKDELHNNGNCFTSFGGWICMVYLEIGISEKTKKRLNQSGRAAQ